jgi:hypothetical protein
MQGKLRGEHFSSLDVEFKKVMISTNLDEKITYPNTTHVALDNQQCFAKRNYIS